MTRQWFYLDALNLPRGPISDMELDRLLRSADHAVFTEGMSGWSMASELFAEDAVAPLVAEGPAQLDDHGQPRNRRFNAARRADREVQELLGFASGIIADGEVTEAEAVSLAQWLDQNRGVADVWPINVLAARMKRIFADGRVDEEERGDLLSLLQSATGKLPSVPSASGGATRLPLCDPAPQLRVSGQLYVFTGKFVYGTRAACQQAVMARGGQCEKGVTRQTNVLVIGMLGSDDWAHSSFGRKIETAVHYRSSGQSLSIVSEEHWASHLHV